MKVDIMYVSVNHIWCYRCSELIPIGSQSIVEVEGLNPKYYHIHCWIRDHVKLMEAIVPVWVELKATKSLNMPPK